MYCVAKSRFGAMSHSTLYLSICVLFLVKFEINMLAFFVVRYLCGFCNIFKAANLLLPSTTIFFYF